MMTNDYTIRDIARLANVSHSTVSRAFNGGYVSEEVYNNIMKICDETGYVPNAIARRLKNKKTNIIGIVVPDIGNIYFSSIVRNLELLAHSRGYQLFISSSFHDPYMEGKIIQSFIENRLEGIIVSGSGEQSVTSLIPYAKRTPMVFIGDNIPEGVGSSVAVDSSLGTYKATKYLIDLGHRKFAFVGGRKSSITHRLRVEGYEKALQEVGIKDYSIISINDGSGISSGYETGIAYFKQNNDITAYMSISSLFALGFIQAAHENGYITPGDFSIIGFDDNRFLALPQIGLSTISQLDDRIVAKAFQILMEMIAKDEVKGERFVIEPSLVIRNTCHRIPV